ncbi:MAG TPA: HupE/UreJ family protein [Gemmatimonadaceae bacterium]|nr:HupE/UreJ family protein [Gemmatimonadaceae bacterium]
MNSDMIAFIELGFRHITDAAALDHILFLLALAAIYRPRDWRQALGVVTAFTVGHSLSLALAVNGTVSFPTRWVEFLIPLTIVVTCVENIVVSRSGNTPWRRRYRPLFSGVFGLVHGAGFANYLRDVFADRIALPLLGFNIGIELGQVVVLAFAALGIAGIDYAWAALRRGGAASSFRVRVMVVSSVILVVATRWAVERNPW